MAKIKIKDKNFTLEYNNKALFKIEKELDIPIIELLRNKSELGKLHTVFVIVHSGIKEDISFDDFCELASFNDLYKIIPEITKEIIESFDTGSEVKKKGKLRKILSGIGIQSKS